MIFYPKELVSLKNEPFRIIFKIWLTSVWYRKNFENFAFSMSEMDSWHEIDLEYISFFENLNLPKMRKNVTKIDWNLEP